MLTLALLVVLSLGFDFLNGMNDAGNMVATIISTRAMPPRLALALTAVAGLCGPFLFGVAVATTVGHELVAPSCVTMRVIFASLAGAIGWNLLTWRLGIPSSSSHALVGGIVGAVAVSSGTSAIQVAGLSKVLLALFVSPMLGLAIGFLFTRTVLFLSRNASPRINGLFRRGQILTAVALALSHGANDAQKTMGLIAMGLVATGYLSEFSVPLWVVAISAGAIALGTAAGGWRIIRTLGAKFYRIRPVHGFCAQLSSAGVILGAAVLGGPVSTTQVASSAIIGAGSAERLNKVRWGVAGNILTTWLLTIPGTAAVAAGFYGLMNVLG